jgi:predicted enzyme related to lactoylglutathione lyase
MFDTLNTVILYTKDIDASKDFYLYTLGFVLVQDEGSYVELKVNSDNETTIAISLADSPEKIAGKQVIVLKTDNIDKTYAKLKEKNVTIRTKIEDFGWGKTFMFSDTDGNTIEVI